MHGTEERQIGKTEQAIARAVDCIRNDERFLLVTETGDERARVIRRILIVYREQTMLTLLCAVAVLALAVVH